MRYVVDAHTGATPKMYAEEKSEDSFIRELHADIEDTMDDGPNDHMGKGVRIRTAEEKITSKIKRHLTIIRREGGRPNLWQGDEIIVDHGSEVVRLIVDGDSVEYVGR